MIGSQVFAQESRVDIHIVRLSKGDAIGAHRAKQGLVHASVHLSVVRALRLHLHLQVSKQASAIALIGGHLLPPVVDLALDLRILVGRADAAPVRKLEQPAVHFDGADLDQRAKRLAVAVVADQCEVVLDAELLQRQVAIEALAPLADQHRVPHIGPGNQRHTGGFHQVQIQAEARERIGLRRTDAQIPQADRPVALFVKYRIVELRNRALDHEVGVGDHPLALGFTEHARLDHRDEPDCMRRARHLRSRRHEHVACADVDLLGRIVLVDDHATRDVEFFGLGRDCLRRVLLLPVVDQLLDCPIQQLRLGILGRLVHAPAATQRLATAGGHAGIRGHVAVDFVRDAHP